MRLRRLLPLLAGLGVLGIVWWQLDPLGKSSRVSGVVEPEPENQGTGGDRPSEVQRSATGQGEQGPQTAPPPPPSREGGAAASGSVDKLEGQVLDRSTQEPVVGMRVLAFPLPQEGDRKAASEGAVRVEGRSPWAWAQEPTGRSTTGPDGRFAIPWQAKGIAFVRVEDDLHVPATVQITAGEPTTIRVAVGTLVEGTTLRIDGVPIEGVLVVGTAGVSTATAPPLVVVRSEADGRFHFVAPPNHALTLNAHHARYLAERQVLPQGPDGKPVRFALTPALVARFRIRVGESGPPPPFVTVTWRTTGPHPRGRTLTLGAPAPGDPSLDPVEAAVEGAAADPSESDAVKIPVTGPTVDLTLASLGFTPFTLSAEPLPPAGDERVYDVRFDRDPTLGRLRVALIDGTGRSLSYGAAGAFARIRRRDGGPRPPQRPTDVGGEAVFEGLPAADYQVVVAYPGYAPGFADSAITAGSDIQAQVTLGQESRLTVKVTGANPKGARFRLLRDGEVVVAYPIPAPTEPASGDPRTPTFAASTAGLTLGGLGAGHYDVELISADLVAPPTPVDLAPGESREVEIAARSRPSR